MQIVQLADYDPGQCIKEEGGGDRSNLYLFDSATVSSPLCKIVTVPSGSRPSRHVIAYQDLSQHQREVFMVRSSRRSNPLIVSSHLWTGHYKIVHLAPKATGSHFNRSGPQF